MKAAQITDYGDKNVMIINEDVSKPPLTAGQVLVEVRAASVNPFDYKVREGYLKESAPLKFPATLGGDLAGVVAQVANGVTSVRVGDEVYGQADALSGNGSYAEFAPVNEQSLAPKPEKLDFEVAASLPLVGSSAIQALVDGMELAKDQKVLIHGGAGGIGSLAIQIAKHLGAYVATTVASEDVEFAKSLGADEVIDYKTQAFEETLHDYDAVFDTVGGDTNTNSYGVLKPGGVLVSMVMDANEDLVKKYKVKVIHQFTKVTTKRLNKLTELIESGELKPLVDKLFRLDDASDALEYLKSGKHKGKVVLKIK